MGGSHNGTEVANAPLRASNKTWNQDSTILSLSGMAKPLVPDDLWAHVAPLLPPDPPRPKGGRPPVPNPAVLTGIVLVLKTSLPLEMGRGLSMTCWRRLRDWHGAGVWAALHRALLERLEGAEQLDWSRAALDSTLSRREGGTRDGAEPDGPGPAGHQTPPRRGRARHAARCDPERSKPPRQHDACGHAGRHPWRPFGRAGPPAPAPGQAAGRQGV